MNKIIHCIYLNWKHPHRWIEVILQVMSGNLTDFSSFNGLLRAVKGAEEREKTHDELT